MKTEDQKEIAIAEARRLDGAELGELPVRNDFLEAVKTLTANMIAPVWQHAAYGTPGKLIGWRCKVCNHDGTKEDFQHDSQCDLMAVLNTFPNTKDEGPIEAK